QGEGLVQVRGQRLAAGAGHTARGTQASGETDVTRLFIAMLVVSLAGCTSTSSLFTSNEPPPPPPAPEQSAAPPASQGAPQAGPRGPMTPAGGAGALAAHRRPPRQH